MQPHQERVVQEVKDLDEKISKLEPFLKGDIFKTLVEAEQERLKSQLDHMKAYSGILHERIEAF